MRFAGNFHPEWGYLAPAPSFLRTARAVIVATAVGATAGAGVVYALVNHSGADAGQTSVAARTLAQPAVALTAPVAAPAPPTRHMTQRSAEEATPAAAASTASPTTDAQAKSTSQPPAAIGALAEVPATTTTVQDTGVRGEAAPLVPASAPAPVTAPPRRKVVRKHHYIARYPVHEAERGEPPPPPDGARSPFSFDRLFNYGGDAPQSEYFADGNGRGFYRGR